AQRIVRECASKAWVQDYANVLLFLAHLSKNRFIVDTIMEAARGTFPTVEPARLEGELSVLFEPEIHPLELRDDKDNDKQVRVEGQKQVAAETHLQNLPTPFHRE